jgi:hypothetical protein
LNHPHWIGPATLGLLSGSALTVLDDSDCLIDTVVQQTTEALEIATPYVGISCCRGRVRRSASGRQGHHTCRADIQAG